VDLTANVTGLSIRGLTLVGSNLYWIDSQGSSTAAIKSVPTTGGTVTTVLADPTLDQNLTTDGTLLYFTWTSTTADASAGLEPSELDSIKVDGTGRTSLVTGFSTQTANHQDPASELFLAGGNFYFVAASTDGNPQLESAPLAGTSSPTVVVAYPTQGQVLDLAYADSTGVYFTLQTITPGSINFSWIPLTANPTPVTLYSGGGIGSFYPTAGQMAVVGNTLYFPVSPGVAGGSPTVTFYTSSLPPTGAATALGSANAGTQVSGMIGDSQGLYAFATGTGAGIYTINPTTGAHTSVDTGSAEFGDQNGEIRALDSKNLYFGASGSSLWAHPRP
jgi:hypothetical protein